MSLYPGLDTINATNDTTQILIYANTITNGWLGPLILIAFFIIAFIGSYFVQMRFGRAKFSHSFAAAAFISFGLAILMSSVNGLLGSSWVIITIAFVAISLLFLFFSTDPAS